MLKELLDNSLNWVSASGKLWLFSGHLVLLAADVYHVTAHSAADHRHPPCQGVIRRGQLIRSNGRHRGPGPIIISH